MQKLPFVTICSSTDPMAPWFVRQEILLGTKVLTGNYFDRIHIEIALADITLCILQSLIYITNCSISISNDAYNM